jgi:hypothetical protein
MSATIDSSLFRFVSVRQPQRMVRPQPDVALIQYELPETRTAGTPDAVIRIDDTQLYDRLAAVRQGNGPRSAYEDAVRRFRATTHWIRSSAELASRTRFYSDFRRVPGASSDPHVETMIKEGLGIVSIDDYVKKGEAASYRRRLFHNLFSAVILADDSRLRDDLLIALKVEQIIAGVQARKRTQLKGESLPPIPTRGVVVLPRAIFPLPAESAPIVHPGEWPPAEQQIHPPIAHGEAIRSLRTALEEIDRAISAPPSTPLPVEGSALIVAAAPALSEPTRQMLGALGSTGSLMEARTLLAERLVTEMSTAAHDGADRKFSVGGVFFSRSNVCAPRMPNICDPYRGGPLPRTPGKPHRLGVADLLVVRQKLMRYAAGEISHITNVMKSEQRETRNRHLLRTEETLTTEQETTTEKLRDLQTTQRFSLENEAKNVVREDSSFHAGVTVTSYGPVTVSGSAAYDTVSSQETATSVATTYAQDVTERALERVTERVLKARSRTTIEEMEENNLHGFDNRTGPDHVVGIYQWVDKIYRSELHNLGRRLMLEFTVPEPAAFFLHCSALEQHRSSVAEPLPLDASSPIGSLGSAADVTELNYAAFAARYGAREVEPPPPRFLTIGKSFTKGDTTNVNVETSEITVPMGYRAFRVHCRSGWSNGPDKYVRVYVGDQDVTSSSGFATAQLGDGVGSHLAMSNSVPVAIQSALTYYLVTIVLDCERTAEALTTWKLKTYGAIAAAYEAQRTAYEKKAASHAGAHAAAPARNRDIEREELKRAVIQMLSGQSFDAFAAMQTNQPAQGYPEFSPARAEAEGAYIKFFESALDWMNMSYLFHPYFWARKPSWVSLRQYETEDPLFNKFLQAGAAQVMLPVQPAYTAALLNYFSTGDVWSGDDAPVLEDELYLSIVSEVANAEPPEHTTPLSTWEVRLPTTLTLLRSENPTPLPDWSSE